MKRSSLQIVLCIAAMFAVSACTKPYVEEPAAREFLKADPDAGGALKAVRGYNKALIAAYSRNEIDPLREYAGEKELGKVQHLIEGFAAQGLLMEADLKRMRVQKIERWGRDNVVVSTMERWRYRRVYVKTGIEQKQWTEIDYHMMYTMTREDGRTWKVFNLSPV